MGETVEVPQKQKLLQFNSRITSNLNKVRLTGKISTIRMMKTEHPSTFYKSYDSIADAEEQRIHIHLIYTSSRNKKEAAYLQRVKNTTIQRTQNPKEEKKDKLESRNLTK